MARLGKGLAALLVIGTIGLLGWAFVRGVESDPAGVGTISTALLAFAGLVYQRSREQSQELEKSHRAEMSPIYEQLVETIQDIDKFAAKPEEEQVAFFQEIATKLTLHGPSPVVRTWIAWLRALPLAPLSVPLHAQEQLLLAIRDDLGLSDNALKRGDLVRLYLLEEDTDESGRSGRTFVQVMRQDRASTCDSRWRRLFTRRLKKATDSRGPPNVDPASPVAGAKPAIRAQPRPRRARYRHRSIRG
jgi:hypothetical protein